MCFWGAVLKELYSRRTESLEPEGVGAGLADVYYLLADRYVEASTRGDAIAMRSAISAMARMAETEAFARSGSSAHSETPAPVRLRSVS